MTQVGLCVTGGEFERQVFRRHGRLEAQNQTLSAKLNAVAAQYNYLIDLVGFQRAISWFEYEKSEEAKEAFLQKVEEALQAE